MARPREFDPDEALDKAMSVFWRQGYEATSVQDLVESMGINRGSLYETFGDKHSLFIASLKRYCDGHSERFLNELATADDPVNSIRNFMEMLVDGACSGEWQGCFMVNTATELALEDREVAACLTARMEKNEAGIHQALAKAKKAGTLKSAHSPLALARHVMGLIIGLNVMLKVRPDRKVLQDMVNVGLEVLTSSPVYGKTE